MPVPISAENSVKRRLRKDEVFDLLLEAILDGTLEPGERIRDGDLERWFGVSRTPIRLAIDRLAELRVIESKPNRYTRVSAPDPERIPQVLDVMCALWGLAAREAIARMTARQARQGRTLFARAATACADLPGPGAAAALTEMRTALFWFSSLSENGLLQELTVKFGTSLRYQVALHGSELDLARLRGALESLEQAVGGRDADAAAAVFDGLRVGGILNRGAFE